MLVIAAFQKTSFPAKGTQLEMTWTAVPLLCSLAIVDHPQQTGKIPSCGARAVQVALQTVGIQVTDGDIQTELIKSSLPHDSLAAMANVARALGASPIGGKLDVGTLNLLPAGSIIHLHPLADRDDEIGHFTLYIGENSPSSVLLADPPGPPYEMSKMAFTERWSGAFLAVYETESDAEAFKDIIRKHTVISDFAILTSLLVVCLVSILAISVVMTRKNRRTVVPAICVMATGLINGCGPSAEVAPSGISCPEFVDVGYVPPIGRLLTIPLSNTGPKKIKILEARASCACSQLEWPREISAGAEEMLQVQLTGSSTPELNESTIVLTVQDSKYRRIRVRYATGDLPALVPHALEATLINGIWHTQAELWLDSNGSSVKLTALSDPMESSPVDIELPTSSDYLIGPNVYKFPKGFHRLELNFDISQDAMQTSNRALLSIEQENKNTNLSAIVQFKSTHWIKISAPRVLISFEIGDDLVTEHRTITVSSAEAGELTAIVEADFLQVETEKVGDTDWVARIGFRSPVPDGDSDHLVKFSLKSDKQEVTLATMTIQLRQIRDRGISPKS